jgi:hypothetical protein
MEFFNYDIPIISRKKLAIEWQNLPGIWCVRWQINHLTILSSFYTRHDLACLLWAIVSAGIFIIAQFATFSWLTQAYLASGLTGIGTVGMGYLTWRFTSVERLAWILYTWTALMLSGTVVTDLSFFLGWGVILCHICHFWLALIGIGYLITGVGMRSRAILLCSIIHFFAIGILPHVGRWQSLTTGAIVAGCVLLLAELQWDSNGVCIHLAAERSAKF